MSFWKKNWWVLACIALLLLCFSPFFNQKVAAVNLLQERLLQMEGERLRVSQKQEELQLRIASQNDPAWIEMILMRDLGVVPEGFLKVHFKG